METQKNIALLLGRIFIAILFIWAGLAKLVGWEGTVSYMASKNMPYIFTLLPIAVAIEIIGGLMLFFGYFTRFAAVILILFVIPATTLFHDFWNMQGAQRVTEMTMFMKDLAIIGGLLYVSVVGPGKFVIK